MMRRFRTAEDVTEGHPDKICDQVSDAVLDEVLSQDPRSRVACETFTSVGIIIVGGEITTTGYVELPVLVRNLLRKIGYHQRFGFCPDTCAVLNAIGTQSPDIAQGVDVGGAGDQGMMVGFACNETLELMPLPISLAHRLTHRLAQVRKEGILDYLGPDGKSQVTVEYEDDKPIGVSAVVIAAQHTESILDSTGKRIKETAKKELADIVIKAAIGDWLTEETKYYINETGKFVIGGPASDTGMTGRKIICDTYGGVASHGGGAFSGKDPTKVDRSAAYMARYLAKNIVKAGLAERCRIDLSFVIGKATPLSVEVETYGTGKVSDDKIKEVINKQFDLTPNGIIKKLNLLRPIYLKTASYGHFGREEPDFTWEATDSATLLKDTVE
ncbi:MAG: methionine adenosyltransferase [Candidatus Stahlbacteria bacterium]|nr:methionine adenosyltransferase [Candidatus Stahlbacteria bacterium]